MQYLVSWGNAIWNGVRSQFRVKRGNFYTADLSGAGVIFVYATMRELVHLQAHLTIQLHEGARVVTVGSDFPDWKPVAVDREEFLFLYVMPPVQSYH